MEQLEIIPRFLQHRRPRSRFERRALTYAYLQLANPLTPSLSPVDAVVDGSGDPDLVGKGGGGQW
jgi:hypothetical protein